MFSRRTDWLALPNELSVARDDRIRSGPDFFDLTLSNPTGMGIEYPHDELAGILSRASRHGYQPEALGLRSAREALAGSLSAGGDEVSSEDLVLTASTSEAYGFLFKLLADPGDTVLTAKPCYPLLEHLASLESVRLMYFPLDYRRQSAGSRWAIDVEEITGRIDERTRALVVVHPNNPTGSYVSDTERAALISYCASRRIALISDEVFLDYPMTVISGRASMAVGDPDCLTFSLGGLSKSAGLPHWKLGWIRVAGPSKMRKSAVVALELIADTFLSVSTPVQKALPEILALGPTIRNAILERVRGNYALLRALIEPMTMLEVLPVEGGWCAILRVPRLETDADLAVRLVRDHGVLVHPGYFFDFPGDGFLVISLLPPAGVFDEGVRRMLGVLSDLIAP